LFILKPAYRPGDTPLTDDSQTPPTETPPPSSDDPAVLVQQAMGYYAADDHDAAAHFARRALLASPADADALHVLGLCHMAQQAPTTAVALLKASVAVNAHGLALHNLGMAHASIGQLDEALACFREALRLDPQFVEAWANLIFALDLHPGATPQLVLAERRRFNDAVCKPLTADAAPHTNRRDPERRLKIGYVSGDFRLHSASQSFVPVLANHTPQQFEVTLISTCHPNKHDGVTTALKEQVADVWVEAFGLSDEALAELIREQQIDVLVDLSGYSRDGKLPMFARRPAPIQITGWGYATGTGLDAMDYLVSDETAIPPEHEDRYHEKIMRLPCLVAYQPAVNELPPIAPDPPMLKRGYVTFGYLGRPEKLNHRVFTAWAEILHRLPTARLLLKADAYRMTEWRERVMDPLVALGVDAGRVQMYPTTVKADHLAVHDQVDVLLDSFPAGGGATTLDACLMGVPTVTFLGAWGPSRSSAAIMRHVGLEPSGSTVASYIEDALEWADWPDGLGMHRRTMRRRLQASPIMDGATYARAFERKVREAWRTWCREQRQQAA
jgi:protein O-GlcNAc transferase